MTTRSMEDVLSPAAVVLLKRAQGEVQRIRRDAQCPETYVSWNEGYLRGAIELAVETAGVTKEELLEWLHRDRLDLRGD